MNIKGQGYSLAFVQGRSDLIFFQTFLLIRNHEAEWSQISCGAVFG